MKKSICAGVVTLLCFIFCSSFVLAAEGDRIPYKKFKPSISLGYAYQGGTDLVLDGKDGASLLGAHKIDLDIPLKHGSYIAGDFQFNFTDRLNLTVGGRIVNALTTPGSREEYNSNPGISRYWESDKQYWVTGNVLMSYAFLKNASFVKDISGVAGVRWDYSKISFKNPSNPSGVASSSYNTIDLKTSMLSPLVGISSTFNGFKSGVFGGDIKVGLTASPITLGRVKFEENFTATKMEADDKFNRYFMFSLSAEATVISAKLGPRAELLASIYGEYTKSYINSDIEMTATGDATGKYNFSMQPSVALIGAKVAIEF